jgi:antitoxin ParD1/3/4
LANFAKDAIFPSMTTMNISLPESLKSFVDSQVSAGDYTSSSEYVRELLRKEQDRLRLRELILDGARSELIDEPMDDRYFDKLKRRVAEKRK